MAGENEELLNGLLGMLGDNPEEKISEILGSLTSKSEKPPLALPEGENIAPDIDINSILKLKSAFSGGNDDDNTRLLSAIKPFLNDKRKPQVDQMLKLLKLANIAHKAGEMDLLKNFKL